MIYETITQFVNPVGLRQLVTNGKTAESTHLTTEQIRTDGGTQARATLNQEKVEEYRQDLENNDGQWPFPPLTVYYDGTDHWLSDGFHRKAAAVAYGLVVVPCEVRQGTLRDAVLAACGANRTHGLSRTAEDKRRAVARMLRDEEWGKWGNREIARHCGVSPTFVGKIRDTMPTVHVDSGERLYTRNGQVQTMDTAEIGTRFSSFECGTCGQLRVTRLPGGAYECRGCGNSWPDGESFMADHHRWMAAQREKAVFINMECGNCGRLQIVEMNDGSCECRACKQKWLDRRSFTIAHNEWKQKMKTAVFLPKHLGELHNKVMLWYCQQRRNNIPGQLELMRSIQQQKSNHELWPDFISAMPAAFNEADLYQVVDHLTEYLQVRADELTAQCTAIPVLQSTIEGWFVNWWSIQDRLNYVNTCLRGDGPAINDIKTAVKHLTYRQEDVMTALKNLKEIYEDQLRMRIKTPPAAAWQPSAEAEPQPGKPLIEAFAAKETMSLEDSAAKVAEALEADNPKVWYALLSKIRKYPFSSDLSTWQIRVYIAKFLLGSTMGDIAAMPDKLAEWGIEVKTI